MNTISNQPSADLVGSLSTREMEIAQDIWAGAPDKLIVAGLGIRPGTLRVHIARIKAKLQVSGRPEVARQFERWRVGRNADSTNGDMRESTKRRLLNAHE